MSSTHRPVLRGTSYTCLDCGLFLRDARTGSRLRQLRESEWAEDKNIRIKIGAIERRYTDDPDLAKRLTDNPKEVVAQYKLADKFNDFLMNPQARPDLQTPEAQHFLQVLQNGGYVNDKTDPMTPWLTREWKKGRIFVPPPEANSNTLRFDGGPEYAYPHPTDPGVELQQHRLTPDQLNHWADWYRSGHPSRQGADIMQMQTPQLHKTIKDWDLDMREKAKGQAETRGDVEHSYPDGWTVQRLTTPQQLKEEGDKMGHCVGGYTGAVQDGRSLIYSLRDHHNEPHATWEVTPRWYRHDDGKLYNHPESEELARAQADPEEGTMVQVQGKANEAPIPEYQQRIKDYFEHKFPDYGSRPNWEDRAIDDLDYLDPDYTEYHAGDYGLNTPAQHFDWDEIVSNMAPDGYTNYAGPDDAVEHALNAGELSDLERATERWGNAAREDHKDNFDDWFSYIDVDQYDMLEPELEDFAVEDPDYPEGYGYDVDAYDEALDKWEKDRDEWIRNQREGAEESAWEQTDEFDKLSEWEDEIAIARRYPRRQQQEKEHTSKTKPAHQHWSTGERCNCNFTRHLEPREASIPTCETCGDPLEHGKCKRCDWGGWSNSPDLTKNPGDPTKELKPGIQASWREIRWSDPAVAESLP